MMSPPLQSPDRHHLTADSAVTQAPAIFVSVVMPTHHRPVLLRRALESLLAQTYPHDRFDITVVASENDAAFDVVSEISRTTDVAIRCVSIPDDPSHGKNPSAKRNYGTEQSKRDWIAFIDDDCVADPQWIAAAAPFFEDPSAGGVEGAKQIPPLDRPTLTYKGLLSFCRPGGYQTCNIFYRRVSFQRVGGFDLAFPFYLEDSDIAWSILDVGQTIPHAAGAIVSHPVTPAAPWRILADAKRARLIPYLYKKHPTEFRRARYRSLSRVHWLYLALYLATVIALITAHWLLAAGGVVGICALLAANILKLFRGCRVSVHELALTTLLLPLVPLVKFYNLLRGNLQHRVWLWT